jgi:hypothetical protein
MEILYHYIENHYDWGWSPITTLCAAALMIWLGIVIIDKVYKKSYDTNTRFFAGCALAIILFAGACSAAVATKNSYDVYKVTIDETAIDYIEFLNTYEIIDQEGKIYVIKERDNDG